MCSSVALAVVVAVSRLYPSTGAPTTLTRLAATAVAANIIDGADDSESVAINEFVAWLALCNGQALTLTLTLTGRP